MIRLLSSKISALLCSCSLLRCPFSKARVRVTDMDLDIYVHNLNVTL